MEFFFAIVVWAVLALILSAAPYFIWDALIDIILSRGTLASKAAAHKLQHWMLRNGVEIQPYRSLIRANSDRNILVFLFQLVAHFWPWISGLIAFGFTALIFGY